VGGGAGDVTAAGRGVRARSARRFLNVLEGLAGIAADDDQAERAARLFGAAEALRAAIDTPLSPGERADYDRSVAATHAALGQAGFAAAWEAGRAMTLDDAINQAGQGC
jgi:hypothetical protein